MATPASPSLQRLVEALRRLPGVGPKSAQRLAFHLLTRDREGARTLASAVDEALARLAPCPQCRMYGEGECQYCQPRRRASGLLCVVETPADLLAIDRSGAYDGRYFVLMGRLSPLDGVGPDQLGFDELESQLRSGAVRELILALNPSVEAEATAYALSELARAAGVPVSRLARGVPVGGELDYVDGGTLALALTRRQPVN